MGIGDLGRLVYWGSIVLLLVVCAWPRTSVAVEGGAALALHELQVGEGDAPDPAEVLSGRLDGQLVALDEPVVRGRAGTVGWWRVTPANPVAAEGRPQLVLRSPFLNRVQAWVPGRDAPVHAAIHGEHADPSHAARALVVDLPQGIPGGSAVWLRVEVGSLLQMPVAVEPLAKVQRDDLAYVAWRTLVLSVLVLLAVLAFVFRIGTGESSFAWFGAPRQGTSAGARTANPSLRTVTRAATRSRRSVIGGDGPRRCGTRAGASAAAPRREGRGTPARSRSPSASARRPARISAIPFPSSALGMYST